MNASSRPRRVIYVLTSRLVGISTEYLQMRIAQIAPLYEAVPPRLYGGTERVVAHLTDALVNLGHDVTLFSSAEARTLGRLAEVRRRAAEFDVIHFHTDMIQFPMFEDMPQKTITTLHGRLDLKDLPEV